MIGGDRTMLETAGFVTILSETEFNNLEPYIGDIHEYYGGIIKVDNYTGDIELYISGENDEDIIEYEVNDFLFHEIGYGDITLELDNANYDFLNTETFIAEPPHIPNQRMQTYDQFNINELRNQMEKAVIEERYEDAAVLRDKIRELEK